MTWQGEANYNDVPARIREFRKKHPDGTLSAVVIHWPTPEVPFIAVRAEAYRSPEDPRPGVGLAWEPCPGKTNFTRDSELQNAETSAWGRAIIAVGAADAKRIASDEEIRNRQTSPPEPPPAREDVSPSSSAARPSTRDQAPESGGDLSSEGGGGSSGGEQSPASSDAFSAFLATSQLSRAQGRDYLELANDRKYTPGEANKASQEEVDKAQALFVKHEMEGA